MTDQTQEQTEQLPINFVYADRDVGKGNDMYVLITSEGGFDNDTGGFKQDSTVYIKDENTDTGLKEYLDTKDSALVRELFRQGRLRFLGEAEFASFERKAGKSGLIRTIPELEK